MLKSRSKLVALGATAFAFLCGLGLLCCTRPSSPGATAVQPQVVDPAERGGRDGTEAMPPREPSRQADAQVHRDAGVEEAPSTIEMDMPEEPEPETPRFVSIVEEIDPARRAKLEAAVYAPTTLELITSNIRLLRVTREGLPLARNRSIVLRIDGQGIEWTTKYAAVELERSPAGAWTVVRRRPFEP